MNILTVFTLLGSAVAAFAATNLDDFILLIGWFSDPSSRKGHIVAGQYLGIGALIALSVVLASLALAVPRPILGLCGVFPIGIGLAELLTREDGQADRPGSARNVLMVAGVTMANGTDNVATYVPLFATQTDAGRGMVAAVFLLMTGIWLASASWFVRHPAWGPAVQRWGRRLLPWVLIGLGGSIVHEGGAFPWLVKAATG